MSIVTVRPDALPGERLLTFKEELRILHSTLTEQRAQHLVAQHAAERAERQIGHDRVAPQIVFELGHVDLAVHQQVAQFRFRQRLEILAQLLGLGDALFLRLDGVVRREDFLAAVFQLGQCQRHRVFAEQPVGANGAGAVVFELLFA